MLYAPISVSYIQSRVEETKPGLSASGQTKLRSFMGPFNDILYLSQSYDDPLSHQLDRDRQIRSDQLLSEWAFKPTFFHLFHLFYLAEWSMTVTRSITQQIKSIYRASCRAVTSSSWTGCRLGDLAMSNGVIVCVPANLDETLGCTEVG